MYRQFGIDMTPFADVKYSKGWEKEDPLLLSRSISESGLFDRVNRVYGYEPMNGDLLCFAFRSPHISHVAVMFDADKLRFVHALELANVSLASLGSIFWSRTLREVYRPKWVE